MLLRLNIFSSHRFIEGGSDDIAQAVFCHLYELFQFSTLFHELDSCAHQISFQFVLELYSLLAFHCPFRNHSKPFFNQFFFASFSVYIFLHLMNLNARKIYAGPINISIFTVVLHFYLVHTAQIGAVGTISTD